jgi:hypothetical protein
MFDCAARAFMLTVAGLSVGLVVMAAGLSVCVYENFQRKKFMTRVYIDG